MQIRLDAQGKWAHHTRRAAAVLAVVALVGGVSARAGALPADLPARWLFHDFIVDLNSMPQTYTCNQLWYKFRDTLDVLGARPTSILPYHCARTAKGALKSPKVEVQFNLPDLLSTKDARYADLFVKSQTVEIAPGSPASITAADCALVQLMQSELIQPLGLPIVKAQFQCDASPATFNLRVQVDQFAPRRRMAVNKVAG